MRPQHLMSLMDTLHFCMEHAVAETHPSPLLFDEFDQSPSIIGEAEADALAAPPGR